MGTMMSMKSNRLNKGINNVDETNQIINLKMQINNRMPTKLKIRFLVKNKYFENLILIVVIVNTLIMFIDH
jgi:hypothetical protein